MTFRHFDSVAPLPLKQGFSGKTSDARGIRTRSRLAPGRSDAPRSLRDFSQARIHAPVIRSAAEAHGHGAPRSGRLGAHCGAGRTFVGLVAAAGTRVRVAGLEVVMARRR